MEATDYTALAEAYDREIRAYKEWVRICSEEPQAFKKKREAYEAWRYERERLAGVGNRTDVRAMLQERVGTKDKGRKA